MRADRLIATVLLMQTRGRITAAELAQELEISVATARRDLEALSTAGVPVYPQPGRGGGWSLVGGARTDLSGLTATEAQALFLLLGPGVSLVPEAKSALRKLLRALPDPFRAEAQAAADAVVVDASRWGDDDRPRPPLVDALQSAVVRRRGVALEYSNRQGAHSVRHVGPLGLVDKDDVWYLVATTDRGLRTFRVDRIVHAAMTDDRVARPVDFDLAAYWDRTVTEVEIQRSTVAAQIEFPERILPVVRGQFGRHLEVGRTRADGTVEAVVRAHMALSIAERLAGWGDTVVVREDGPVRAELARIGAGLVAAYGSAGPP